MTAIKLGALTLTSRTSSHPGLIEVRVDGDGWNTSLGIYPAEWLSLLNLHTVLDARERTIGGLSAALAESLKLQSHYAKLLNMYDGGQRVGFASVDDWMRRLREIGALRKEPSRG